MGTAFEHAAAAMEHGRRALKVGKEEEKSKTAAPKAAEAPKAKEEPKAKEAPKAEGAKPSGKKTVKEIHLKKAKGGFTAVHKHEPPHDEPEQDEEHVVGNGPGGEGDIDPLHAHLEQHVGAPNEGEPPEVAQGGPGAEVAPPQGAQPQVQPGGVAVAQGGPQNA
jgi:hypothetical protein